MKIHRPVYFGIIDNLSFIFNDGYYADKVVERSFRKNRQWGAKDRRMIAQSVYGMVRWWRKLCVCLDMKQEGPYSEDELQKLFELWLRTKEIELPPYIESEVSDEELKEWTAEFDPEVNLSVPDWIYKEGVRQIGEDQWCGLLKAMNRQADIYLRVNSLKTDIKTLRPQLENEGVQTEIVDGCKWTLRLLERKNVFITEAYKAGCFEVQDGGSQKIVELFDLSKKSMRVIDACAGAGGKSLQMAAMMKNKGKLIALDVHQRKLNELRKRSSRAGVDIIETRLIEDQKVIKRLKGSADALLLDVPCSGIGVLKRSPDTKWKLKPQEVVEVKALQKQILNSYSSMVKAGGQMVYATCSLWPEENELQVEEFLKTHPDWEKEKEIKIWPSELPFDGFYGARLRRRSE